MPIGVPGGLYVSCLATIAEPARVPSVLGLAVQAKGCETGAEKEVSINVGEIEVGVPVT